MTEMNYDEEKYKIWDWKSLVVLHWIINPGLVINDLILGQTIPKVMLIERGGKEALYKRSFVPCPHCGTFHNGLKWSYKRAFKNWFGYYCDNCTKIIPVHRNLTTLIVLAATFPIWGWFRKSLKQNWIAIQPERFKDLNLEMVAKKTSTKSWIKSGLLFGIIMFFLMSIVFPLIDGEEITWLRIYIGIPLWLISGLGFGYFMKKYLNKKGK